MTDELWQDRYNLFFAIRRSIDYHSRRQQFFDRLHTYTSGVTVVLSSATIYAIFKESSVGILIAGVVTVLTAIDLVVGYTRKSCLHNYLARKFIDLHKKLIAINPKEFTDENLRELTLERLNLEAEEPPKKRILDSICHNDLLRADGITEKKEYVRLTGTQRFWAQFFDYKQHEAVKFGSDSTPREWKTE